MTKKKQTYEDIKCFKCEQPLYSAMVGVDPWEGPAGAVTLEGGWNFGSSLYDAMMDGIYVEVAICDDCLKAAANDPQRMREMRKVQSPPPRAERVTKRTSGEEQDKNHVHGE